MKGRRCNKGHIMKEAAERKNSIDFLKVCATVLIVFHHYEQEFGGEILW